MAFKVTRAQEADVANSDIIAAQDLYFDASGRVVKRGPKAVSLLVREGRVVPRRYEDLVTATGKIKQAKKAPIKKAPTTKARKPSANKSRKGSSDK